MPALGHLAKRWRGTGVKVSPRLAGAEGGEQAPLVLLEVEAVQQLLVHLEVLLQLKLEQVVMVEALQLIQLQEHQDQALL